MLPFSELLTPLQISVYESIKYASVNVSGLFSLYIYNISYVITRFVVAYFESLTGALDHIC